MKPTDRITLEIDTNNDSFNGMTRADDLLRLVRAVSAMLAVNVGSEKLFRQGETKIMDTFGNHFATLKHEYIWQEEPSK